MKVFAVFLVLLGFGISPVVTREYSAPQGFERAGDVEFETLIEKAEKLEGVNALVVTLKDQMDVDAGPSHAQKYYQVFRDMVEYVEEAYGPNNVALRRPTC